MNYIFYAFLILSGVLMLLLIGNLVQAIKLNREPVGFKDLLPRAKAQFILNLAYSGFFLRHILLNDYPPRDDKSHVADYTSFLNMAAVGAIKHLKGGISNESY